MSGSEKLIESQRDKAPFRESEEHYRAVKLARSIIQWTAVQLPGLHKNGNEIPLEISFAEFSRDGRHFFTGIARHQ